MKLTKEGWIIEQETRWCIKSATDDQFQDFSSILNRQKDAVLNMRINSDDLNKLN